MTRRRAQERRSASGSALGIAPGDPESIDPRASHFDDLQDITDPLHRCAYSAACPTVLRSEQRSSYVIIGTTCDPNIHSLKDRVGDTETAVEISAEILEAALQDYLRRKL